LQGEKEEILKNQEILSKIEKAANLIIKSYKNGGKILTAGNGGSAGDAQHIAAEFVSKFFLERPALSAISLTTNTSILTSIGNDYDHEIVFARQVQAHGKKEVVFIAISTSGNSKNVVRAAETAQKNGLKVIGLIGKTPAELDKFCDIAIKVPSSVTPIIQESHIMIAHIICALVEKEINL
jgi:D-sedoheptulose 7-phosphate isomerase